MPIAAPVERKPAFGLEAAKLKEPVNGNEWIESKKGWVYEKKRHMLVSKQMVPRWMVLYSKPIPSLALYEQRSDAKPPYTPLVHYNLTEIEVILQQGSDSSGTNSIAAPASDAKIKRSNSVLMRGAAKVKDFIAPVKLSKPVLQVYSALPGNTKLLTVAVENEREAQDWLLKLDNERLAYQQSLFKVDPIIEQADQQNKELKRLQEKELRLPGTTVPVISGRMMESLAMAEARSPASQGVEEMESLLSDMALNAPIKGEGDDLEASTPFGADYLNALSKRFAASNDKDRLRWELEAEKIKASFAAFLMRHATKLVDNYHRQSTPSRQSLGPHVQLEFLAGYADDDYREELEVLEADLALKNEILAQNYVLWQTKVAVLTPLMLLIEYKGFRLLGYCTLPLNDANCVYDGNRPSAASPEHALMEQLARALYLGLPYALPGEPAEAAHFLHPAVQLHRIREDVGLHPGGLYISNLHLMLPAPPSMGGRRLRPELLQRYKQQQGCDDLAPEKAVQAVDFMLNDAMKELAETLESNLDLIPASSAAWTKLLHSYGINCCLIGRLAKLCKLPHTKEQLVIEMIARAVKGVLRLKLREAVIHFRQVQALKVDSELKSVALAILNEVLSRRHGWSPDLQSLVEDKFGFVLEADVFRNLSRPCLFAALRFHSGIQFHNIDWASVAEGVDEEFFLKESDFVTFLPRPVHNSLLMKSEEELRWLELARVFSAASLVGGARFNLYSLTMAQRETAAKYLGELAETMSERRDELQTIAETLAPPHSSVKGHLLLQAAKAKIVAPKKNALSSIVSAGEKARMYCQTSLGEHHPSTFLCCLQIADLCQQLAQKSTDQAQREAWQQALKYRQEALHQATKVLGKMHKLTKELVVALAGIHKALGNYQEAIVFYLEAIANFKQHDAQHSKQLALMYLEVADCHKLKGDLEDALEYTKNAQVALGDPADEQVLDQCLLQVAQLVQDIYPRNIDTEHTEVLGAEARGTLESAADSLEQLFERLRSRADALAIDGDNLVRILKNLCALKVRLASPAQRTVVRAVRTAMVQDVSRPEARAAEDAKCKDMLVRMVTMSSASQHIARILDAAVNSSSGKGAMEDLRTLVMIADFPEN